ncbi:hypothetical protein [Pseudomonas fluorescens]|uniref:Lipoprotein n=1 Tax=Pseudomonas fluorescens TaxID=294 RepID=A0A5E7FKY9_PSEFL|nr:hypothetical protein [Pseudomonas fluorescens]VVO39930.1 hypothetical protein PS691_05643 [Pseudomonas fluorescens]
MNMSKLPALVLAGLLSSAACAGSSTPTNPVYGPPSATATDPRIDRNDTQRPDGIGPNVPDNAGLGTSSKTTTGGSGSDRDGGARK